MAGPAAHEPHGRSADLALAVAVGLVPVAVILGFLGATDWFRLAEDDGVSLAQPLMAEGFRQMSAGRLPLWSDHTLCGAPLLAAPGGQGLLYPGHHVSHWVGRALGFPGREVCLSHLSHAGLAAAFAFAYLRAVGVGRPAAALGGIPYGLNGPMVGMITNWNDYAYWLPYVPVLFVAAERLLAGSRSWGWPAAVGLCVGLVGLASGPVGLAKVGVFGGLYFILRANRRHLPAAAGRWVVGWGLGLAGCCGQLVPTLEWIGWSVRVSPEGEPRAAALGGLSVSPEFYRAVVYPFVVFVWPEGFNGAESADGVGRFTGEGLFAGPLASLALVLGLARYARRPGPARALMGLAAVYALLSLGSHWAGNFVVGSLPFFKQYRWPARWTPEFCGAAALLTGVVLDRAWRDRARPPVRRLVVGWVALVGLAVTVHPGSAAPEEVLWGPVPRLYLLAAGLLAYLFLKAPGPVAASAALLATVASLAAIAPGAQAHRWGRMTPLLRDPLPYGADVRERVLLLAPRTEQRRDGEGNHAYALPHQTGTHVVLGYGPFPLKTQTWWAGVNFMGETDPDAGVGPAAARFLGRHLLEALRVGVVVVPKDDATLNSACRANPDLEPLAEHRTKAAYRHRGFREPAFGVREVRKERWLKSWADLGAEPPSRVAFAENDYDGPPAFTGELDVRDYSEKDGRIRLTAAATGDQFLVLTTTWYPGWEARVGGEPARLWRVNGSFMGIAVPPGEHEVTLEFRPRFVPPLVALSGTTLLGLVGFCSTALARSARRGTAPDTATGRHTL